MTKAPAEAELAERIANYLKVEMKRHKVTYDEMAQRLRDQGLNETRDSVAAKLKRGTFAATFMLACFAALKLERINLEDI